MKMNDVWKLFQEDKPNERVHEVLEYVRINKNNYMQRFKLMALHQFDELSILRESNLKRSDIEQVKALFTRYYMLGLPIDAYNHKYRIIGGSADE